jgi:plastocyanin
MRFFGQALIASAVVLGACAGGNGGMAGDTAAAATTDTAAAAPTGMGDTGQTAATTPPQGGAAAGGGGAAITGKTHEVQMVLNEKGEYRFVPQDITIKQGDGIKWVMVSGGPHNVAFDPAKIPDDVEKVLSANMPNQMMPLGSPMYMNPGESYTISFAGIKAGKYPYQCTPHLAMGMVGNITVQ